LITVAKAVQTDQVAGFAVPLSRAVYAAPFVEWLMPTLWGLGGEFLNADETAAFNGEAGVRVYQWLYDLVHKHKVMPSAAVSWSVDNGDDMFKSGKLAMLPNGSMRVINARRAQGIGKNLQTAPLIADRTDRPCSTLVAGYTYTMTKDSKEKEAAWHFIEHMISPEAEVINAKIAGEMPTRKSTYKDPWFETDDAADMRQWMSYLANYGRSIRTPAKFMTLSDMLAVAVQDVIVNHVPPKRALDDVAKKWNAEIGKA